jgi:hypothetical protein
MQSAPAVQAPDPTVTAAAQTASNKETAITQAELNNYDKIGPDGSLTYTQNGTNPDGTPKFTQTTALSDSNQGIYNTNQTTKQNIATIGADQSAKIGALLGTPFSVDNAISDKITSLGAQRLDPRFAQGQDALNTRLANQGIMPGSQAWKAEQTQFGQTKNDAYNQLYLSGDAQAEQESLANRNQPINEISALMSGSQVGTPTFAANPNTSVAGTDVAGITQNSYLDANQQAQQSVAGNNAMMGGLFSLAGTGATAAIKYSDRRLKRNIERIGTWNGLGLYSYRYIWGASDIGVMADEVERVMPDAVSVDSRGFKMVDYSKLEAA